MTCQESMRPSSSMSKTKPATKNPMPCGLLTRRLASQPSRASPARDVDRAEQADDPDGDQVRRDDVVEQPRHDEDQDARDQRDQRAEGDDHGGAPVYNWVRHAHRFLPKAQEPQAAGLHQGVPD